MKEGGFVDRLIKKGKESAQKAVVFGTVAASSLGAVPVDNKYEKFPIPDKDKVERLIDRKEFSPKTSELVDNFFSNIELSSNKGEEFTQKANFWREQHSEGGPNHQSLMIGWGRLLDTKNKKQSDLEVILEIFEKEGVPKDLVFLALAESYWNKNAYNKGSQAGGPWQFIPATAERFGLTEKDRYDIKKSTEAACKYLKWLKNLAEKCAIEVGVSVSESDLWHWAFLAYNRGEGHVLERPSGKNGDFFKYNGDINEYIKNCKVKESVNYPTKISGIQQASFMIFKIKQNFAKIENKNPLK